MKGYEVVDMSTSEGRAKVAAYEAAKAEKVKSGQQLYAKIKRTSKYYGQGEKGALFPVFVEAGWAEGYDQLNATVEAANAAGTGRG